MKKKLYLCTRKGFDMIPEENRGEIIIYRAEDNSVQLDVRMEKETVWLTQDQMAMLFGRDRTVIGRHIRNVFKEGELNESSVCAKFALPKKYGRRARFRTKYYLPGKSK